MLPAMKGDEDKCCLKWDRFHQNITSMFDDLRQSEKLVDVTLCTEGHKVKVHRLTVSACSPYLRNLLKDNPCEHPVIVLTDTTTFDLVAIVELMYRGAVYVPHVHLERLMKTLKMLQIEGIGSKGDKAPPAPVATRPSSSRPTAAEASTSEQHSPHHEPHRSSPRPTKRRRSSVQESSPVPRTASPSPPPPTISPSPPEPDSVADSDLDDLEVDDYETPAVDPLFCPESEEQLLALEKQLGESADLVNAEEGEINVERNVLPVDEAFIYDAEFHRGNNDSEVTAGNSADAPVDFLTTGSGSYHCQHCDCVWASEAQLHRHIRHRHGLAASKASHKCERCDYATDDLGKLKRHIRVHTVEKRCFCKVCGKAFRDSGDLIRHTNTHTGERPYICNMCGKAFAASGSLTRHKRTHTGEKPYTCNVCGRTFAEPTHIIRHKRTHTGERPYTCDVCGKTFGQSGDLRRHQHTHTGKRPYTCNICGKGFVASGNLAAHKRTHTGKRPYT